MPNDKFRLWGEAPAGIAPNQAGQLAGHAEYWVEVPPQPAAPEPGWIPAAVWQEAIARNAQPQRMVVGDEAEPSEGVVEGKAIDLNQWLGKNKNRVYRTGIELEGGWTVMPPGFLKEHDGSVFDHGNKFPAGCPPLAYYGETKSAPIELITVPGWVKTMHPQVIDNTCGLHVHMSFKSALYYDTLMDSPNYQATMIEYLRGWAKDERLVKEHCIWDRLDGKEKYCRPLFWPDLQAIKVGKEHNIQQEGNKRGHRYTMINYCWGLGNETVEVRVLPMMPNAEQTVRAIQRVIDVTNAYLCATVRIPRKRRVVAKASGPDTASKYRRVYA